MAKTMNENDRIMNDTKFSALRGRRTRQGLAGLLFLLCVSMPWTQSHRVISIVAILGIFALWGSLYRINRGFMDLPSDVVDERIRMRRNEIYRFSYFVAVIFMFAFVMLTIIENSAGTAMLGTEPMHGFMGLSWLMLTLPTILFSFSEREV